MKLTKLRKYLNDIISRKDTNAGFLNYQSALRFSRRLDEFRTLDQYRPSMAAVMFLSPDWSEYRSKEKDLFLKWQEEDRQFYLSAFGDGYNEALIKPDPAREEK